MSGFIKIKDGKDTILLNIDKITTVIGNSEETELVIGNESMSIEIDIAVLEKLLGECVRIAGEQ